MSYMTLYAELNAACILMLLLLSWKLQHSAFLQRQRCFFQLVLSSNIAYYLLDFLWLYVDGTTRLPAAHTLNWLINILYYIVSATASFIWFLYAEKMQESHFLQKPLWLFLSALPLILVTILAISSPVTHLLIYIDENNHYFRGRFFLIQAAIGYGYVIVASLKALVLSIRTENLQEKQMYRTIASFIVPSLIAATIQECNVGFPTLCVGTTISILNVYISLQEQLISLDPLTKLNNRNQLNQYIYQRLRRDTDNSGIFLLVMDIDRFKGINDHYGHDEGDHALLHLARCLKKSCQDAHDFIARYGGDEFIVIHEGSSSSAQALCRRIHASLAELSLPYPLTVSIGTARHQANESWTSLLNRADAELYKIKHQKDDK